MGKSEIENRSHIPTEIEVGKRYGVNNPEDPEVKAELNTEITALEQINTDAESFIKTNENKFSLFGWLARLF